MDLELKDKIIIVTGASKGIGLATVHRLVDEGAQGGGRFPRPALGCRSSASLIGSMPTGAP